MSTDNPSTVSRDSFTYRQMLHRLSTQSSNASNGNKRGSARVTKTTPSNSPHYVQRRRTNPTHTTRSFPRIPQDSPYATRDQRLRHYYSQYPMEANRPNSWHPGSDRLQTPYPQMPVPDSALGTTITGMENLAVAATPHPSVEQSIHDAFSLAYGFPVSQTPTDFVQPGIYPQIDHTMVPTSNPAMSSFPSHYSFPASTALPATGYSVPTQEPNDDIYNILADYQIPKQRTNHCSFNYSSPTDMSYQSPMQWQESMSRPQDIAPQPLPLLQKKKSKELVGLGLYDDKKEDFLSALNTESNRESLGKDLKLEETWQPPKENGEDEEASSSDEAEDEVPENLDALNQAPIHPQTFYPTYGDLSNQSFFFNDDEQQLGHDAPFVNYVAFEPEGSAKAPLVAETGNLMWL